MTDTPRGPKTPDRAREHAGLELVRSVARAGSEGAAVVVEIADAVKRRNARRAERDAAKVHYLGMPPKP